MGPDSVWVEASLVKLLSVLAAFVVEQVPVISSDVPGLGLSIAVELVRQRLWLAKLLYKDVFRPAVDRELRCYVWAPRYCRFQGDVANQGGDVQVAYHVVQ